MVRFSSLRMNQDNMRVVKKDFALSDASPRYLAVIYQITNRDTQRQ